MTTDTDVSLLVGTMPAYSPAAEAWSKNIANNPLYAFSPYDVMKQAAGLVNPKYTDAVRYSVADGIKPLTSAIEQGNPVEPTLADCQTELKSLAEKEGYEVVTQP
jgi:multiple sugar transport system substrate-binding protein